MNWSTLKYYPPFPATCLERLKYTTKLSGRISCPVSIYDRMKSKVRSWKYVESSGPLFLENKLGVSSANKTAENSVLGYDTVLTVYQILTFQHKLLPPSSGQFKIITMKMEAVSCAETNYHQHVMSQKTIIFISKCAITANRVESYWLKANFVKVYTFFSIFTNMSETTVFQFDNSIPDLQISLSL